MSPDLARLFEAARAAQARAYAPYSRFSVGAALRDATGAVHAGCNVENAAYPVGTCAEAGAIAAMVTAGGRAISEMLVIGPGPGLVTPCGACRQRIREFAASDMVVHVADGDGIRAAFTLAALLPESFGPENLGSHA